jgi:hypothetical protein
MIEAIRCGSCDKHCRGRASLEKWRKTVGFAYAAGNYREIFAIIWHKFPINKDLFIARIAKPKNISL